MAENVDKRIDLGLKINSIPINADDPLTAILGKGDFFKKLGFFAKKLLGLRIKGQDIYFVKNCIVSCFDGKFVIMPRIDAAKYGPLGMQHATSAYIFAVGERIKCITLQCIGNQYMAEKTINEFTEACATEYGNPFHVGPGVLIWSGVASRVVAEWAQESKNAYIHWELETADS